MKIKKQYIGCIISKGKTSIELSEVVDERFMEMLKIEFPHYLEEDKPKKAPKKKDVESDEVK